METELLAPLVIIAVFAVIFVLWNFVGPIFGGIWDTLTNAPWLFLIAPLFFMVFVNPNTRWFRSLEPEQRQVQVQVEAQDETSRFLKHLLKQE